MFCEIEIGGRMGVVNGCGYVFDGFVINVKEVLVMVTADLVVELTIELLDHDHCDHSLCLDIQ
jgi:hypothetical protein